MGDLGGQKHHSGRGSPQHKHTKSTSLSLSLGKNPRDTLYTGLLSQRRVIRPYAIISSISHALCSVHHPILLFLSLYWGLFVPLSPFLPASMAPDRTHYCQHQRCVYIKGFSGGLTLVLAKLD